MPTRRAILLAGAGLAAGCEGTRRGTPTTDGPSRGPRILDLTDLKTDVPPPTAVKEAGKAAVRILTENPNRTIRIVTSGVRVAPDLVLGTRQFRQKETGEIIEQRLHIQMAINAGKLVVKDALRAAVLDRVDTVLFEHQQSVGPFADTLAPLSDMQSGTILHHVGYQTANKTELLTPIFNPAPKAGFRLAFLHGSGDTFYALAGLGPSEGNVQTSTLTPPSYGGPIFIESPDKVALLGLAIKAESITIGDIWRENKNDQQSEHDIFDQVIDSTGNVDPTTKAQLITGKLVDEALITFLQERMAVVPPSR
ncbi:MAG TPA: hypothetical protein VFB59_00825 [Candidatus Saccharimonadales bacterium]|nr:hypothetical protein [Candidatus Saccharimonadales bacterium]